MAINPYTPTKDLASSPWMEQITSQLSTTRSVLRACVGWVFELGISAEMPFFQKKNLALINGAAFISLLLALPGTFALILMGFAHPFSLLVSGVLVACLTLGFNGARQVGWSKALFAFAPAVIILAYTLLELSSQGMNQPLNYILARQGLCFSLLLPVMIYGFDEKQTVAVIAGLCLIIFLLFDVGSMHFGAFQDEIILGVGHGLFSLLSLVQYAGLAGSVLYMQHHSSQHARLVQQANEKLNSLAVRDGLTNLFNHRFIEQLIEDAINRSKRSEDPLALLMIDVDYFKQVNDTFGHIVGDELLVRLTRLLNSHKRSTDYLGRWGGDELILLLTDTDLAGAYNVAEKLRSLVETQLFSNGKRLTISLGASEYQNGDSTANFITHADTALYRAKHGGRNRTELYQTSS